MSSKPTVYVLTVHWHSEQWIDIQLRHLDRWLGRNYKIYAYLNGISPELYKRFDHVETDDTKTHPEKLNYLANLVCSEARDNDILLFIDGDAFPVSDLGPTISSLSSKPLVAVQRYENNGDIQPHPCFCLTTVSLWSQVGGDWCPGGYWKDSSGREITDVGGKLLHLLRENRIEWQALLRSNHKTMHPLWFGLYGDVVYHHGAGFRDKLCRLDAQRGMDGFSRFMLRWQRSRFFPAVLNPYRARFDRLLHNYMRKRNQKNADRVFNKILHSELVNPDWF